MGVLSNFRQAETRMFATTALTVAVAAGVGCAVMAVRQDRMSRRMDELQKAVELNAAVTLNIVPRVAHLSIPKLDNQ